MPPPDVSEKRPCLKRAKRVAEVAKPAEAGAPFAIGAPFAVPFFGDGFVVA